MVEQRPFKPLTLVRFQVGAHMIDWHTLVGAAATIVMFVLLVPYIRSILKEDTRPNPVSWFGWTLLYGIAAVAQASQGFDWSLAIPAIGTVSTGVVGFVALRTGKAMWTKIDRFSITVAILAIVLWVITKEPLTALVLSIIADLAVSLPTLYKTYTQPFSEPWLLWVIYSTAVALELLATTHLTIYNLLVPVYSFGVDVLITLFSLRQFLIKRPGEIDSLN